MRLPTNNLPQNNSSGWWWSFSAWEEMQISCGKSSNWVREIQWGLMPCCFLIILPKRAWNHITAVIWLNCVLKCWLYTTPAYFKTMVTALGKSWRKSSPQKCFCRCLMWFYISCCSPTGKVAFDGLFGPSICTFDQPSEHNSKLHITTRCSLQAIYHLPSSRTAPLKVAAC